MTNLTSEQYRDVLKHVKNCTEKLPTVQQLLRKAVETFFNRFGAYPDLAGVAPGKIGLFGEQTQFDNGVILSTTTPMVTIVVGRRVVGSRFSVVTTADVGKPHKVTFSFSQNRPLAPGCPIWLNYVKGIIENYKYDIPPFEAAIESSIPMGVGFGSSSALEIAVYSFLEVLVGKKADPLDKALACEKAEKDFELKAVGLMDKLASVSAKDRHAMLIDCKTNEVQWIPFDNSDIAFVAIDSHERDFFLDDEYSQKSKYIAKACEILGVESLRGCTEDSLVELENRVKDMLIKTEEKNEEEEKEPDEETEVYENEETKIDDQPRESEEQEQNVQSEENVVVERNAWSEGEYDVMIKRAKFFVTEMKRISQAVEAWNEGDVETFGNIMKESHVSLKEDFNFSNPLLNFLVETSLEAKGVLGSKMIGMGLGFGGGIISLIKKENIETYCNYVMKRFLANRSEIQKAVEEERMQDKEKLLEINKKTNLERYNSAFASSDKMAKIQNYFNKGATLNKKKCRRLSSKEQNGRFPVRIRIPCSVKPPSCKTWGRNGKDPTNEEFFRKKSAEVEEEKKEGSKISSSASEVLKSSEVSGVELESPTFYVVSPFAGARMMFVTKTDILRSLYAVPVPHHKALVRSTLEAFKAEFGREPETVGVAPGTLTLFGEFMEFHLGYLICMALPLITVTVGGRNDTVNFSVRTTCKDVEEPTIMKSPLPCVRALEIESRGWVNFILGCVNEFRGHVPGFDAVISSTVPVKAGLNSCSALQASVYTFLECLTRSYTTNLFEKADRCAKSEYEFQETPSELVTRCSTIKFFPTFLCKEGNLMFVNCQHYKISQYFFDHPSYVFLVGCCKINTTDVTVESLDSRLKICGQALELLGRNSLLTADLKHLRCLKKRDASEETIKRVKYIITEHQRTLEAVKAIKEEDYQRVGLLMNESHASLRDDYEVSSPEIESLISLALQVEGVLGAKMLGRGLNATVIILLKISDADKCIKFIRKNYRPRNDKPKFYLIKPMSGAFTMNLEEELSRIP